jgi:hypothetical protein
MHKAATLIFCDNPRSDRYDFIDNQCGQYGGEVVCESQICSNYCGGCTKRRCENASYVCFNNYCGTWICA